MVTDGEISFAESISALDEVSIKSSFQQQAFFRSEFLAQDHFAAVAGSSLRVLTIADSLTPKRAFRGPTWIDIIEVRGAC